MKDMKVTLSIGLIGFAGALAFGSRGPLHARLQDASVLQQAEAPPNGIWVDSLDLSTTPIRRPRGGGPGRAGQPAPTPPPPLVFALGGVTYPHAVPLISDRDLVIGLNKQAVSFASMVGIDS